MSFKHAQGGEGDPRVSLHEPAVHTGCQCSRRRPKLAARPPPRPTHAPDAAPLHRRVGSALVDGHGARRPQIQWTGGAAQVRAVLGVRLPLVADVLAVNMPARVHLQAVHQLVADGAFAPGRRRLQRGVIRGGVCQRPRLIAGEKLIGKGVA